MIRRSASLLDDSWKDETILVQGIIDAYFTEDGEIVLVDYKTDRVRKVRSRNWLICIMYSLKIMRRRWSV